MTVKIPHIIRRDRVAGSLAAAAIVAAGQSATTGRPEARSLTANAAPAFVGRTFTTAPLETSSVSHGDEFVCIQVRKESWTRQDTKRFKELAIKHALDEINPAEEEELAWLQAERRSLASPLDAEQILAEFRRAEMLADLKAFVQKHGISIGA